MTETDDGRAKLLNYFSGGEQSSLLAREFINCPERFEPTDHALLQIFQRAVEHSWEWLVIPREARMARAKAFAERGTISDLTCRIVWAYSSTAGKECPVLRTSATFYPQDGSRKVTVSDGGVAFVLDEFIKRKEVNP